MIYSESDRATEKFAGICSYHRWDNPNGESGLQAYFRNRSKGGGPTEADLLKLAGIENAEVKVEMYGTLVLLNSSKEIVDEIEDQLQKSGFHKEKITSAKQGG